MTFQDLLWQQYELQTESFKIDFEGMTHQDRARYISWNMLALDDELHEALAEISWKPWTSGEVFNRDSFIGELVDAFHFMMNLLLACGGKPEELASQFTDRYTAKRAINAERQIRGYDGFSDKCDCGRAVEDGTMLEEMRPRGEMFYRCVCGRENCLKMDVT